MRETADRRPARRILLAWLALATLALPLPARAGKLAWLDEVVQQAVREAEAGKSAARAEGRAAGRLFTREADESLEVLFKRSDDLARAGGRLDQPAESVLRTRFDRMVGADPELARTFSNLAPAEKRLVVEMGETAQRLARRYPGEAQPMIRTLGVEGLEAVRVYGDDVAGVIAKEGPESIGVLRKTGRAGWSFFTDKVLPNKKKLAAAGVLTLFLANPEKFVDTAGQATQYAVEQFAKAGIQLAGAVGGGATKGLESAIGQTLASYGLDSAILRKAGMVLAGVIAFLATMVILGLPVSWVLRPVTWPLRRLFGRRRHVSHTA